MHVHFGVIPISLITIEHLMPPPTGRRILLLESSGFFLLESGGRIEIENSTLNASFEKSGEKDV